ncbi:MAG TPA: helix-turn-helix transcriptional regulator [Thermoanaerobacterales bacterium]|nr:helix-turn-helix transcriptional regulator [Thermoanaerobacterales bacterium]
MRFAYILKNLREQRQLSREELAKAIDVSYWTIAKYESGTRMPDIPTLIKLSNVLDVTTDYLLGRAKTPNGTILELNTVGEQLPEEIKTFLLKEDSSPYIELANLAANAKLNKEELSAVANVIRLVMNQRNQSD